MNRCLAGLVLATMVVAGPALAQIASDYDVARTSLVTSAEKGPSPQGYGKSVPKSIETVRYTSKAGEMLAWVMRPAGDITTVRPVLVFAHGGFALGAGSGAGDGDNDMAKPFVDAGFIVMLPAVRGENGNPGNFEVFLGEVDDVIAAGRKAKTLAGADPDRVYLFGHSIGGGLATLAALSADHPFRIVGAAGGNYSIVSCKDIAAEWGTFKATDAECKARFPDTYLPKLKTPLYSYVGTGDGYASAYGRSFKLIASDQFHLVSLNGDHFSSVDAAIQDFIAQTRK
ncbi:MAG: prolyl oligopeptidase family serine peptidase [Hyphomonadaceae bacterium]